MSIGTAANAAAIKKNVKAGVRTLWLKECDSSGTPLTTGDGTTWTCAGFTKGTKVSNSVSEEKQTDDTGATVQTIVTLDSYMVDITLMQRDAASRNITKNTAGRYYQAVLAGNTVGTLQEVHALAPCQFGRSFSYAIGDAGQVEGLKLTTISNTTTISVTVPTEIVAAGTVSIGPGEMWATADL